MTTITAETRLQSGPQTNGQPSERIVHFDATSRRKEKMKQRAAGEQAPAAAAAVRAGAPPRGNGAVREEEESGVRRQEPGVRGQRSEVRDQRSDSQLSTLNPRPSTDSPLTTPHTPTELEQYLIDFVVEQTGYPPEMVELDADLEADLGIDSIKKAQLFGELADECGVQVGDAENLSLDDFPTLRHVLQLLVGGEGRGSRIEDRGCDQRSEVRGQMFEPGTASHGPQGTEQSSIVNRQSSIQALLTTHRSPIELEQFLVDFVVEQTGYPAEIVELDADLETDLGIDSIKKAQLFGELAERFDVQVADAEDLSLDDFPTLRHVVELLAGAAQKSTSATAQPVSRDRNQRSGGRVREEAGSRQKAVGSWHWSEDASTGHRSSLMAHPSSGEAEIDPQPSTSAAMSGEELDQFLVSFVVEQTGYPPEMVELDADLEADLGIDSIKKAQLFGELAEHFDVQVSEGDELSLDDFPTLRHVRDFLEGVPEKEMV